MTISIVLACKSGFYNSNANCTNKCGLCKDNATCNNESGRCPDGCELHFKNPLCQGTRYLICLYQIKFLQLNTDTFESFKQLRSLSFD